MLSILALCVSTDLCLALPACFPSCTPSDCAAAATSPSHDNQEAIDICTMVIGDKERHGQSAGAEYMHRANAYLQDATFKKTQAEIQARAENNGSWASEWVGIGMAVAAQDAIKDAARCVQALERGGREQRQAGTCYQISGYAHRQLSAYYVDAGSPQKALNEFDAAVADFNKAKDRGLNVGEIISSLYRDKAVAAERAREYRAAIASWEDAISASSQNSILFLDDALFGKARAYQSLGDLDQALAQYAKVIENDPGDAEAFFRRGRIRWIRGEVEPALADFTAAAALHPDVAEYQLARGRARLALGDAKGAVTDLSAAIAATPDAPSYLLRARARRGNGDLAGALADLDAAIARDGNLAPAYFDRGFVKMAMRDLDGALADFDAAIQRDDASPTYLTMRGILRAAKGDLDRAIVDYGAAITLDPDPQRYAIRAWALLKKGKPEDALNDANHALALEPRLAVALVTRGHAHEALAQPGRAIADYRAALAAAPGMADAQASLKRLGVEQ